MKRKAAKKVRYCEICQQRYISSLFATMYCGNACKIQSFRNRNGTGFKRKISVLVAVLRKVLKQKKRRERAQHITQRLAGIANRKCIKCNSILPGFHTKYCSRQCRAGSAEEQAERKRAARRRQRKRYGKTWGKRARAYGVRYERISRHEVFHWDGWRCQICGIETPQSLDGSNCSNAPTIDHIIPISKGGHHVFANIQTACRSCNTIKGDRL